MLILTKNNTNIWFELVGNPGGNKQRLRLEGIPTNREIWHHRQKPPLKINQIKKYDSKQISNRRQSQSNDHFITQRTTYYS